MVTVDQGSCQPACTQQTCQCLPGPRPTGPGDALAELLTGNARFVAGRRVHPNQDAEHRMALAEGQRPFAVLFGCSDSRLAAEMIFDQGLGDLFVVRTAGHIVDPGVLASIEYAVEVLGTPLVVVLGHDSCGAIAAAMDGPPETPAGVVSHLGAIVERVAPSIEEARLAGVTEPAGIVDWHVRRTVEMIMQPGGSLAAAVAEGRCAVVGMSYRLVEGRAAVVCRYEAA